MTEEVVDPRTDEELMKDTVDRSPGFTDLLHRYNLIGDYENRTLTGDQAMTLAREAYETGIFEYRLHPEEIDSLEEEFEQELARRH